jgi:hypothetical protein
MLVAATTKGEANDVGAKNYYDYVILSSLLKIAENCTSGTILIVLKHSLLH